MSVQPVNVTVVTEWFIGLPLVHVIKIYCSMLA